MSVNHTLECKEVGATVSKVMEYLNFSNQYMLSWQSAVRPSAWLGPQTKDMVEQFGKRGNQVWIYLHQLSVHTQLKNILLVPIAFTSDHIETLSELDIEIAEVAHKSGVKNLKRAPSLNDSPLFADALADLVATHLKTNSVYSKQYLLKCPACANDDCRRIINPIHT